MAHKGCDRDFKLEAIRLASKSGVKVSAVERRLGISNRIISLAGSASCARTRMMPFPVRATCDQAK